jgi:hypothetical protein
MYQTKHKIRGAFSMQFTTADMYSLGVSEEVLGRALRDPVESTGGRFPGR